MIPPRSPKRASSAPDPGPADGTGARVLVVDDAPATLEVLARNLLRRGYRVVTAPGVLEAIRILEQSTIDLVITDLKMPGASGLDLTRHVHANHKDTEIMMITGYPSVEGAVQAVKYGAEEYLPKPFTDDELQAAVTRVLEKLNRRSSRAPASRAQWAAYGILGESSAVLAMFDAMAAAARSQAPLLIEGESGTGKELVARAIHHESPPPRGRFLSLCCEGMDEGCAEAELFGGRPQRQRGTRGGSEVARPGLLELAAGGTVFVSAVDQLGPRVQARLAAALAPRRGRVAARLMLASDLDLASLVERGGFEGELYLRVSGNRLRLPPLRERGDDVLQLAAHFAGRFGAEWQRAPIRFTDAAAQALCAYDWPGNLRQLRGVIRRLTATAAGSLVDVADLPPDLRFRFSPHRDVSLGRTLEEVEAEHIRNVMIALDGNKARAAEQLGIDRKTLREKLRRYMLDS